jgi:hypothetical protein
MNQCFVYVFHRILSPLITLKTKKPYRIDRALSRWFLEKLYLDKYKYWRCGERLERARLDRLDADYFALLRAFRPKIYRTGDLGEQGMILAHANVFSRMYPGSTLANDNASSGDEFPTVALHAQAFGI